MQPDELRCLALLHVPGKGELDIQRCGNGLVNESYQVLRDGIRYVLRIAAANPHELGVDRAWEARVLECAAAADLARDTHEVADDRYAGRSGTGAAAIVESIVAPVALDPHRVIRALDAGKDGVAAD